MSDSKNEKLLIVRGVVTEALPNTLFKVRLSARNASDTADVDGESTRAEGSDEILAYLSGKMRIHRIKVLIGDSVEVVLDPYGGKGRIIKRL
ncbi:hypothetical protein A2814_00950 [Candidatus Nomurabacteria bacterium RIFCSPHIGHO2_01_FULL_38_19]|uniref:S1-like domain-containing protein n=1 Tax=Candidatus Nomurabacteria bacterium RIFCSPHIGHO2_01_FULL_38_19 TaxID=1801732 RepID=A0A1F6URV0_9BACT|nr:MAG: hypothetical protein A2814_00950 [Candidatus Nomurabacteria bacterium RIFCSPHIGHO2_01_FULL_38_19]